jgi:hypothetical protein
MAPLAREHRAVVAVVALLLAPIPGCSDSSSRPIDAGADAPNRPADAAAHDGSTPGDRGPVDAAPAADAPLPDGAPVSDGSPTDSAPDAAPADAVIPVDAAPADAVQTDSVPPFSPVDDLDLQRQQLLQHVATGLPAHVPAGQTQQDLDNHPRNSQYDDEIAAHCIFGSMACGLVACAGPFRGSAYERVEIARWLRATAATDYGSTTGIQPLALAAAVTAVFGAGRVQSFADWTLGDLYEALRAGRVVIVDIRVGRRGGVDLPAATAPNFAHFARVLGLDTVTERIHLENSLLGDPVWSLTLAEFWEVWKFPETGVSIQPAVPLDNVTRWALVFDLAAVLAALPPAARVSACAQRYWVSGCIDATRVLHCRPGVAEEESCSTACVDEAFGWHDHCQGQVPSRTDELDWMGPCIE